MTKDDDKTLTALELNPYAVGEKAFIDEIEREVNEYRSKAKAKKDIVWPREVRPEVETMERTD